MLKATRISEFRRALKFCDIDLPGSYVLMDPPTVDELSPAVRADLRRIPVGDLKVKVRTFSEIAALYVKSVTPPAP